MSAEAAVISTGADQPYWDGLAEGRVRFPRCAGCGRVHWPAVWRCGDCGSWEHAWFDVEPVGQVYTWSRTWHRFPGLESLSAPFISLVVTVDATEGRRLTGILEGDDAAIRIGARVRGRIATVEAAGRVVPALRWRVEA
ncbi:Zn-ribbon domain-containing OB-fold protein [Phenylobacterium sp.]|uniref:Zn-ribbon domain-containing OB-fold protein n=1 Tax=Phenylobacterium sp. TaxID=1871053 RepID=UPI002EDB2D14